MHVATAMLHNSSLVIRRVIFLLCLTQKQEKKVRMNAVVLLVYQSFKRQKQMLQNYGVEGSRGHLGVSKRAEKVSKQKVKETTGEGALP